MNRRALLIGASAALGATLREVKESKRERGVTVKLTGLDPRFVAQLKVAAESRGLTLEQWIVYAAVMFSGYHLNDGFVE